MDIRINKNLRIHSIKKTSKADTFEVSKKNLILPS